MSAGAGGRARTSARSLRLVRPGSRVLDVGCGEGELLELLAREKGVDGRGLEISPEGVSACLARGLAVVQGDADRDLDDFPSQGFDYAILSQTLQAVREPRHGAERIAAHRRAGHRLAAQLRSLAGAADLLASGRMPVTGALPEPWWSTPNIHLCTLRDFTAAVRRPGPAHRGLLGPGRRQARAADRSRRGPSRTGGPKQALFLLSRPGEANPAAAPPTPSDDLFDR